MKRVIFMLSSDKLIKLYTRYGFEQSPSSDQCLVFFSQKGYFQNVEIVLLNDDVKPEEIILNIGYKSDGIITRNEYTNEPNVDLTTAVSVGDSMEAKVIKVNDGEGQVLLSYKRLAAEKGRKLK